MAGMFYSLKEAAKKLNKTEDEVKEIVKKGQLREFRDGSNLLFKVDEVKALMPETIPLPAEEPASSIELQEDKEDKEDNGELLLASDSNAELVDTDGLSGADTNIDNLTDADTSLADEGINVLGEGDNDYQLADDSQSETKAVFSDEASLEEIEGDVNLDSFGSGSGLLDLSLQADDTSLGGILDEIYTPEGGGEDQEAGGEPGSPVDVAAEAEQMITDLNEPQPAPEAAAIAQVYVEPEADPTSNMLGVMLFLPLLIVIYTALVAIAGFKGMKPGILEKTQGIIWYIVIAASIVAASVAGASLVLGKKGDKTPKKPKVKKEKKVKVKKEKKAKEPKKEKS